MTDPPTGPWDSALDTLREWNPEWAELCFKMSTNPWTHCVLPHKFIELVSVALNAACTNLNLKGTRLQIQAALEAGATREEVLLALKCGSVLSIHSCNLAAPIVLEKAKVPTPSRLREPIRNRPRLVMRCGGSDNGTRHGIRSSSSIRYLRTNSWRWGTCADWKHTQPHRCPLQNLNDPRGYWNHGFV